MLPVANGTFQLIDASKPGGSPIATAVSYRYSSYTDLPIGKYRLNVAKADSSTPLKAFDIVVRPDSYFTILVSPEHVDIFEDTEDPKAQAGILTIRNFFQGVAVTATIGQTPLSQPIAYGQSYSATGLPLARTTVTLRGTLPDGKPVQSSVDLDFSTSKRATALVIPDSYGRFRPRITPDGKNP